MHAPALTASVLHRSPLPSADASTGPYIPTTTLKLRDACRSYSSQTQSPRNDPKPRIDTFVHDVSILCGAVAACFMLTGEAIH
jgi:hypothetical protein